MAKYTKRRDKRRYEWKSAYREKEALMLERGYPEVSPHDFYRELFPAGSLQQEPEDGKGNIIATQIRPSGKGRTRQWVIDDSLKMLDKVIGDRFGLIPPISFYGKSHTKENAHELFAVVVDVDYVGKQQLKNLLKQFGNMKVIGEVVNDGRPTAEQTVREWQESHPAGKKADCIRETGLSKPTVYKWWK